MQFPAGDSNVTVVLPAPSASVRLWWPAGAGAQPLYNVSATLRSSGSSVSSQRKVSRAENALSWLEHSSACGCGGSQRDIGTRGEVDPPP